MSVFITSDIHGDLDALEELLSAASFNVDRDKLYIAGDFCDRGPKTLEVYRSIRQYGWTLVKGNHCDAIARLARGNPVMMTAERADTVRQLGTMLVEVGAFIDSCPLYMPFEDEQGAGYVVHAGVAPSDSETGRGSSIETQSPTLLLRMRTWPFTKFVKGEESTAPAWQDSYTGHLGHIVHGHIGFSSVQAHGNPLVWSLDGGAMYGGVMRLLRLGDRQLWEQPGSPDAIRHYRENVVAHDTRA